MWAVPLLTAGSEDSWQCLLGPPVYCGPFVGLLSLTAEVSVTQPPPSNTHGTRQPALLIVWPAEGYVVFWFLLGSVDESEELLSQTPEMSFGSKRETKRVRRRGVVHESPFHHVTCFVSKLVV